MIYKISTISIRPILKKYFAEVVSMRVLVPDNRYVSEDKDPECREETAHSHLVEANTHRHFRTPLLPLPLQASSTFFNLKLS